MKIHRKVEYALIVFQYMAEKQKQGSDLPSAREVCLYTREPFNSIARVMQSLSKANFIQSIQGVQGGYHLIQSLDEINLYELMEALLGSAGLEKYLCDKSTLHKSASPQQRNIQYIQKPLARLDELQVQFYKNVKISDLLSEEWCVNGDHQSLRDTCVNVKTKKPTSETPIKTHKLTETTI